MTEIERRKQFNDLYAQFERRVLAYCLYVTGDKDTAHDVFQEVFVKAYQSIHSLKDAGKASHWLFRIARNECLNSLKATQRQNKRSVKLDSINEPADTSGHTVERRDEFEHLRRGIAELPEDYREALLLAEFEGFSLKEIAEITCTSLSNVKIRIHRAKQKLHTILEPILKDYE